MRASVPGWLLSATAVWLRHMQPQLQQLHQLDQLHGVRIGLLKAQRILLVTLPDWLRVD